MSSWLATSPSLFDAHEAPILKVSLSQHVHSVVMYWAYTSAIQLCKVAFTCCKGVGMFLPKLSSCLNCATKKGWTSCAWCFAHSKGIARKPNLGTLIWTTVSQNAAGNIKVDHKQILILWICDLWQNLISNNYTWLKNSYMIYVFWIPCG